MIFKIEIKDIVGNIDRWLPELDDRKKNEKKVHDNDCRQVSGEKRNIMNLTKKYKSVYHNNSLTWK